MFCRALMQMQERFLVRTSSVPTVEAHYIAAGIAGGDPVWGNQDHIRCTESLGYISKYVNDAVEQ